MALTPRYWREHKVDGYTVPDVFTEGNGWLSVREGFYNDPSMSDPQLIERWFTVRNQFDRVVYQEHELWSYDIPGGPPMRYERTVEATVYLPVVNVGRALIEVERDVTAFWTLTPWATDVLAYRKEVSGYVVVDMKPDPDLDSAAKAKARAMGYQVSDDSGAHERWVIDTQRWWREAIRDRSISEAADVNQTARWVDAAIVEETEITEEFDRWTRWVHTKNRVRPDDNRLEGPEYIQKQGHVYRSSVPVDAPKVEAADAGGDGVRVRVRGGGASVPVGLPSGMMRRYFRPPESFRVYRKKVSEPDRAAGDDPYGNFVEGRAPQPRQRRQVIESTFIGSFDGTPATGDRPGLPVGSSHTEPGDPAPPVTDGWEHVADGKNEAADQDSEPHCTVYDPDVRDQGEYAYVAVAVVADSDSPLSNEDRVTKRGDGPCSRKVAIRTRDDGTIEADYRVPLDPAALPPGAGDIGYGETVVVTVPALVTDGPWPVMVRGATRSTAPLTVNTGTVTIDHAPLDDPGEWQVGRRVQVTDRSSPGSPGPCGTSAKHAAITGTIKEVTATQTVLEDVDADGSTFPDGSDVELLDDSLDPRSSLEVGEGELGTIQELAIAIGDRQGMASAADAVSVSIEIPLPLLGLRNGMEVFIENVNWESYCNDLRLASRLESVVWRLRGFQVSVNAVDTASAVVGKTTLRLEER